MLFLAVKANYLKCKLKNVSSNEADPGLSNRQVWATFSGPEPGQDPWKSPKRCVPALDFRYPDFFSESNPDSGRYLQIFGSYPGYDIYLQKNTYTTNY